MWNRNKEHLPKIVLLHDMMILSKWSGDFIFNSNQWRRKVPKSVGGGHTDTKFMYLR